MLNKKALAASVTAKEIDSNFKQTVLLLHGDGTNGAQNNTFTDSSTNNFTITRNGNTTQGTFSPFSVAAGEWSNYFDGSGDYLKFDNGTFYLSNNNFVIEAFVYLPNSISGSNGTIAAGNTDAATAAGSSWDMTINTSQKLASTVWIGSTNYTITSSASVSTGQWVHLAFVRTGGTISQFINGTKDGTNTTLSTNSVQNGSNTYPPHVGRNGGGADFPGYISNFRLIVGSNASSVYDATGSSITAPTAPLTAVTDTKVLTCRSNRFVDISSSPNTVTPNGNTSVQPFSPFAPSAAYSASTNGGSGYFDGTGDTLVSPTDSALALGTSNFCVEFWFDAAGVSQPANKRIIGNVSGGSWGSNKWTIGVDGNNIFVQIYNFTTVNHTISTTTNVLTAQWNHIALCRSGNDFGLFINGTRVGTYSSSGTMDGGGNQNIVVGGNGLSGETIAGYIADFRTVIGSSVYTPTSTTLTVPTAPLIAITNTKLLLNFTNAAIFDQTGKNNLETVGNAQIDTGTKKFGTGSLEFDGTGDWLKAPSSPNCVFGTGDFTFECWVYPTALTASTDYNIIDFRSAEDNGSFRTGINGTSVPFVANSSGGVLNGSFTFSTNTWYHFALTRASGTLTLWVNGTSVGSNTTTTNFTGDKITIGASVIGNGPFVGFIDDIRVTKGIARYTATFTPPAKAFADQ